MKKSILKKGLAIFTGIMLSLVAILCIHIYLVTRPKAPDARSLVMARVDIKQAITTDDANKITAWLYQQPGVDHVLCNPKSDIVVFTFFPARTSADNIIQNLKRDLNLANASRFMPSAEDLKSGCPVASNSISYKFYSLIKHIF
jgi:hypothetical protein